MMTPYSGHHVERTVYPDRRTRTSPAALWWVGSGLSALLCTSHPLAAQWLPAPVAAVRGVVGTQHHPHSPTYWLEGATLGLTVLGATASVIAAEFCGDTDSRCDAANVLAFTGFGALLGGTIGGLIGGAFPASHPRPLRGHPARSAGIGAAAAAVWGFGLLAGACLNGCRDDEAVLIVSTITVGALAGLLLGL